MFFERQGIATVVVGLIRLHLEKIRPPRALWVPFELGRPLGGYTDNGGFQKKVLRAALSLCARTDGPVILEDFPDADPGEVPDANWLAPALSGASSVLEEVQILQPLWLQAGQRLGRTMVGLSTMPIEQSVDYLERFFSDNPAANPADDMSDNLRMRFCADDIRTFYQEAALAAGNPTSTQIGDWFWGSSRAGQFLHRIRDENLQHDNVATASICGKFIVPGARLIR